MYRIEDFAELFRIENSPNKSQTEFKDDIFLYFNNLKFFQKGFFVVLKSQEKRAGNTIKVEKSKLRNLELQITHAWVIIYDKMKYFAPGKFLDFYQKLEDLGYTVSNSYQIRRETGSPSIKSRRLRSLRGAIKLIQKVEQKPIETLQAFPLTKQSDIFYFNYNLELVKSNKSLESVAVKMNLDLVNQEKSNPDLRNKQKLVYLLPNNQPFENDDTLIYKEASKEF